MNALPPEPHTKARPRGLLAGLMAAITALLPACQTAPHDDAGLNDTASTTASADPLRPAPRPSAATTARAYRKDAAEHVYALNSHRIHQGKLPPMLYAIGVLEVDIDRKGQVSRLRWSRAPQHAPEVVKEIERTVRAAAPFPVPAKLGRVTYIDTWLWDESGHFQLDTLTEGQL